MADGKQKHKDLVDDYYQSVFATYAFAESACWDEEARKRRSGSEYSVPRKMDVDDGVGEKEVTPDGVIQPTVNAGIVVETKKNLSSALRESPFPQLAKYDNDLLGWWTNDERIPSHDLVLLTHLQSGVIASDLYDAWVAEGNSFSRPFALVEFGWTESGQVWFWLRRLRGQLSDLVHDETLRKGKSMSNDLMTRLIGHYKFMDNEPPLMHMLLLIYNYILPLFAMETEFSGEGKRTPIAEVTITEIRAKLEEQFCPAITSPRQFKLPKAEWVEKAMESFVSMGVATRVGDAKGKYRIPLKKPPKKDVLEYFADRLARPAKKSNAQQTDFFGDTGNDGNAETRG